MESRDLAALLSSLISQLLLLIILLFPSSNPHSLFSNFTSNSYANGFSLITHFLLSQEIAASSSFLSDSRKRKRTPLSGSELKPNGDDADANIRDADDDGRRFHLARTRNPDSFRNHFKMTSSTFEWLSGLLEPLLECRDPAGTSLNLSAEIRLGVGLSRLATGCEFSTISNQFGVSESVARFCVKQLCRVLCTNFRFWIEFPCPNELESTSSAFEGIAGIPNCCGVITCTRFKIINTNNLNEDSIATQLVVDSSSRILSIIAGFHGEKEDSTVLVSSTLFKDIEEQRILDSPPIYLSGFAVNQYLVGHGEYPLLPWLMVPFTGAVSGSMEESFNEAHRMMSIPAVRAVFSLRNWGVLSKPMHEEFKIGVAYIGACSILHNALLMRDDFSAVADEWESFSLHDHSSKFIVKSSEESLMDEKGSIIRRALAMRAREVQS